MKDPSPKEAWLSSKEAAKRLGVKRASLYAYVSRGLIQSRPADSGRGRRYSAADVARVWQRSHARSGHGPVAAGALNFGEPVLTTSISSIGATGPAYRGAPAVELARTVSFEQVVSRLWAAEELQPFSKNLALKGLNSKVPRRNRLATPLDHLLQCSLQQAMSDPDRGVCIARSAWPRAALLVRSWCLEAGPALGLCRVSDDAGLGCAALLARSLGLRGTSRQAKLIDAALTLCADHELNASTFASRVAASAGADLYACVNAAISVFSGYRHGTAGPRLERLLRRVHSPSAALAWVRTQLSEGRPVPGFGHPLYPEGDPRAVALLELGQARCDKHTQILLTLKEAMALSHAPPPNLDFGLLVLCHGLGLPSGASGVLFAIGRSAGWLAHAFEQWSQPNIVRPRAQYLSEGQA